MSNGKYVLAFNSSPRKEKGFTAMVLERFMAGAASAGAETETVYLAEKKIADCLGCTWCWFKTPGVCRHKDDVPALHVKMLRADVLVYATPLYICTMSAIMKRFLDRIMPLAEPYQEYRDGACSHPHQNKREREMRTVLLSTCGFPGLRNFDPLVFTFERIAEVGGGSLHASILFPSSVLLARDPCPAAEQLEYVYRAGQEAVGEGIREETVEGYSRPFVDPQEYVNELNEIFRVLRENATRG
ncbi:MAG: flavodoxin family protein [Actinobacteria bacterium]|nr:flavodoxin family protein [Actinomycetota bacterium]